SQSLSNALASKFIDCGGTVHYNTKVEKIIVENGAVQGVVTESGDEIATRFVVSNTSRISNYVEHIDREHVPEEIETELRGVKPAMSVVSLNIGFDCEPDELGIAESTNFILSYEDIEDRSFEKMMETRFHSEYILLSCFDVADPQFSPEGTCQVAIVSGQNTDLWRDIPPSQYADSKYQCADLVLKQLERVFPNLRNHVEEIEVATPLTYMRYLGHQGGSFYGFEQNIKDSIYLQPSRRSPIKGLFHAGAWVTTGGFQPTLESGTSVAKEILEEIGQN
ncbi:MAG: NAD(P)/FAD-dependent oxidoreductase, partial [Proteobacteria bacterium]|nr:NAD(P)/FAD-dependent oxidoreductase [Pseudomonadota bacterium]